MTSSVPAGPVLAVTDLSVALPQGGDRPFAVEDVGVEAGRGETVCLVGESRSGKSVVAQAILGMLPPQLGVRGGSVAFEGDLLPPQRDRADGRLRSARMVMIFQDAGASLDPLIRVGAAFEEIAQVHGVPRAGRRARVTLRAVRLAERERIARSYPHQLSGGQAQRIAIAGALPLDPVLLIADEPTTALDVTTQAGILRLIAELRRERGTAILFITHDFGVVSDISGPIVAMREGKAGERGTLAEVLDRPKHAHTRAACSPPPRGAARPATRPRRSRSSPRAGCR